MDNAVRDRRQAIGSTDHLAHKLRTSHRPTAIQGESARSTFPHPFTGVRCRPTLPTTRRRWLPSVARPPPTPSGSYPRIGAESVRLALAPAPCSTWNILPHSTASAARSRSPTSRARSPPQCSNSAPSRPARHTRGKKVERQGVSLRGGPPPWTPEVPPFGLGLVGVRDKIRIMSQARRRLRNRNGLRSGMRLESHRKQREAD